MNYSKRWIATPARRCGKSALLAEMEADFIRDYPDAVIVRPQKDGSVIVEKPVKAIEEPLTALPPHNAQHPNDNSR